MAQLLGGQQPTQIADDPGGDPEVHACHFLAGAALGSVTVNCAADSWKLFENMQASVGATKIGDNPDRYQVGDKANNGMVLKRDSGRNCTILVQGEPTTDQETLAESLDVAFRNLNP